MPAGVLPPPGSAVGGATSGYEQLPQFAHDVSAMTGVDPRVIFAWAQQEGAYAPNGTGHFNYLNLRPYSSDVGEVQPKSSGFAWFDNEHDAAVSTARRIRQPFIWSAPVLGGPGLGSVVAAKGSPAQEIAAIGRSGWDAGHYQESGGAPGSSLEAAFESLYGKGAAGSPPKTSSQVLAPGGTQTGSITSSIPGVKQAEGIAGAIGRFADFVTSVRLPELIGGIVLVSIGLFILARALLSTAPVKLAGTTVGNFQGARDEGASRASAVGAAAGAALGATPAGRARSAARAAGGRGSRSRRVSREGTGRPRATRSFESPMGEANVRARARRAASSARSSSSNGGGPGELPADY